MSTVDDASTVPTARIVTGIARSTTSATETGAAGPAPRPAPPPGAPPAGAGASLLPQPAALIRRAAASDKVTERMFRNTVIGKAAFQSVPIVCAEYERY